jgi:aspartate oxidase
MHVSALARAESRGMHRRLDSPETNAAFQHRIHVGGLDDLWVRPDRDGTMMLAS